MHGPEGDSGGTLSWYAFGGKAMKISCGASVAMLSSARFATNGLASKLCTVALELCILMSSRRRRLWGTWGSRGPGWCAYQGNKLLFFFGKELVVHDNCRVRRDVR